MGAQHDQVDAPVQDMLADQGARPSALDKDLEGMLHAVRVHAGRDELRTLLHGGGAGLGPALDILHDASGQRRFVGVQDIERLVGEQSGGGLQGALRRLRQVQSHQNVAVWRIGILPHGQQRYAQPADKLADGPPQPQAHQRLVAADAGDDEIAFLRLGGARDHFDRLATLDHDGAVAASRQHVAPQALADILQNIRCGGRQRRVQHLAGDVVRLRHGVNRHQAGLPGVGQHLGARQSAVAARGQIGRQQDGTGRGLNVRFHAAMVDAMARAVNQRFP